MRSCFRGYDDRTFEATDASAPWRPVIERLGRGNREVFVIWSGDNVSETSFLAMPSWRLGQRPEPLLRVGTPERDDPPCVALHAPAELAGLYSTLRALTESERVLLAADSERIRDQTGLLRLAAVGEVDATFEGGSWTVTPDNGESTRRRWRATRGVMAWTAFGGRLATSRPGSIRCLMEGKPSASYPVMVSAVLQRLAREC